MFISSLSRPIYRQCFHHIEDIQLIFTATQLTGFHLKETMASDKLTLLHPDRGRRGKINLNFYFHTSLWCLKRFLRPFILIQLSEMHRAGKVNEHTQKLTQIISQASLWNFMIVMKALQ